MSATARDLRTHTRKLLEAVDRGEEVVIAHRGKPCAPGRTGAVNGQ